MGNCCKSTSAAAVWAGDDWSSVAHHRHHHATMFDGADDHEEHGTDMERQRLLGTAGSLSSGSTREVKIRVTKRELEEIMARVNLQGFSMEQVLARLVNSADLNFEMDLDHKHWKPALQSIPEVN